MFLKNRTNFQKVDFGSDSGLQFKSYTTKSIRMVKFYKTALSKLESEHQMARFWEFCIFQKRF